MLKATCWDWWWTPGDVGKSLLSELMLLYIRYMRHTRRERHVVHWPTAVKNIRGFTSHCLLTIYSAAAAPENHCCFRLWVLSFIWCCSRQHSLERHAAFVWTSDLRKQTKLNHLKYHQSKCIKGGNPRQSLKASISTFTLQTFHWKGEKMLC